jgi:hypothetical protein
MAEGSVLYREKMDGFHGIGMLKKSVLESKGHDPFRSKRRRERKIMCLCRE